MSKYPFVYLMRDEKDSEIDKIFLDNEKAPNKLESQIHHYNLLKYPA